MADIVECGLEQELLQLAQVMLGQEGEGVPVLVASGVDTRLLVSCEPLDAAQESKCRK